MSYKNAMAGLAMGGGKAVILADDRRSKTPELLAAFAHSVDSLGGRYVTAQDVGISADDVLAISKGTKFVSGLPPKEGGAGGDPGPSTALGVYLGVRAAVQRALLLGVEPRRRYLQLTVDARKRGDRPRGRAGAYARAARPG